MQLVVEDVKVGSEDAVEGLVDAGECQGNFEEPLEPLERLGQQEEEGQDHQSRLPPDHAPLERLERPLAARRCHGRHLGRASGRGEVQKHL